MNQLLKRGLINIQYYSDLHLEKNSKRYIEAYRPYLILAGDIGYPESVEYKYFLHACSYKFEKVFVIAGNHEYDNYLKNLNRCDEIINEICSTRNNLIFLQKKTELLDTEFNIYLAGCTFWSEKPVLKQHLHFQHKNWLKNLLLDNPSNMYIIATHHPLTMFSLNSGYIKPNYFASYSDNIILMPNFLVSIYGHTHFNRDLVYNRKLILTNQYGSKLKPKSNYNLYGYTKIV